MKWYRAEGVLEKITLGELLTRKMQDYGYKTLTALGNDIGLDSWNVRPLLTGEVVNPSINTRRNLCRVLDIAPEVLERAIRNSMGGYK